MAVSNQDILLKLEVSEAYFADQIDKLYQSEKLGIINDCECNNIDDIFYTISALRFRVDRSLYDDTSIALYNRLERDIPIDLYTSINDPDYINPGGTVVSGDSLFSTFLSLFDTPNSYAGQANKIVTVASNQSGLIFS